MDGRAFLAVARNLASGPTEAHRRAAAGRGYHAPMPECLSALLRWGFAVPPRENLHSFVRLRFLFASEADPKAIGRVLDNLVHLRTWPTTASRRPAHSRPRCAS